MQVFFEFKFLNYKTFCNVADPGMEVFTDPITGKMFIKTKDGKIMEIITDPKTGKVYMRTASGNLKELPPGMELYVDPTTGKMYIGTKPKGQ